MEAGIDGNYVKTWLGWDGTQTRPVLVDPSTGAVIMKALSSVPGAPSSINRALKDGNYDSSALGVSDADGSTIQPWRVDASGNLIIKII